MNNNKGSTLAIAMSMVFLFGAMGMGALEYAGGQSQYAVIEKAKDQAFWLADAGLQQSVANGGVAESGTLTAGTYSVSAPVACGSSLCITSTGTVNGLHPVTRTLKAVGTLKPLFNSALISGSTSAIGMNVYSPITINNYNSNGSAGTGTGQIEANSSEITLNGATTTASTLPSYVTTNAGVVLPLITVPSALQTASCPGGGTFWNVTADTTWSTAGNYQCSYIYVASGVTLSITAPINLYLTATDPATGPDETVNAEDLRGGDGSNPNLGFVKILSGGSLTIYAAGRITTGPTGLPPIDFTGADALNTPSNVDFENQDPWLSSISYSTGDYVTYNNEAWVSKKNNNLGNTPSSSSSFWNLSTYNTTTSYALNAYVTYNGGAWRSTANNNLDNTPSASSSNWILSNNPIPADLIIYSLYVSPVAWNSTATYQVNDPVLPDLVSYAGGVWESIQVGINQPPAPGSAYWSSIVWNNATTYPLNALVYYNGLLWQSSASNNVGNAPDYNPSYWQTWAGVKLDNDTHHFYGLVYSPQSLVYVNRNETISGSVVANMINIQTGGGINYDQSLATDTNLPMTFSLTSWKECPLIGSC